VGGLPIANADIWFHCREMCFRRKLAEKAKASLSDFILWVRRGLSLALLGRGPRPHHAAVRDMCCVRYCEGTGVRL